MKVKIVLSVAVLAFGLLAAAQTYGQPTVNVVITYKSTANSYVVAKADAGALMYTDRPNTGDPGYAAAYGYRFLPDSKTTDPAWALAATAPVLSGATFIRGANGDKTLTTARHLEFTIDWPCTVYIAYDKRATTEKADWLVDGTWTLEPGLSVRWTAANTAGAEDGSSPMLVYSKFFDAGKVTLGANLSGVTATSGIAATSYIPFIVPYDDPSYNPAPVADAGPDQVGYLNEAFQLAGTVTDQDPEGGPAGNLSYYWYKVSGPGTASFSNANVLDATVTFSAKGIYELMLQATDGDKDANDVMRVLVKNRDDEFLVGRWDFEDDSLEDLSINNNNGTLVALNGGGYDEDAATGLKSMNLTRTDPADPNLNYVDLGPATQLDFGKTPWSVAGWFKTTQTGTADANKGNIFSNGGDSTNGIRYILGINEATSGAVTITTDNNAASNAKFQATSASTTLNDDSWHFAIGVREVDELAGTDVIRIYVDGVLETTTSLPADYDLSGTSQTHSYIGVGVNFATGPAAVYKHLNGRVDDVRVYNYALPLTDDPGYDSVVSLTAMGPIVAKVDAGQDVEFSWKPGREIQLTGVLTDPGRPGDIDVIWDVMSAPVGASVTFTPADSLTTSVGFTAGGVYVLKLSAYDEGVWVNDTVRVTVIAPTCADVKADGLIWTSDLNEDCKVDLMDLVILVSNWAACNDPADTISCQWPWD